MYSTVASDILIRDSRRVRKRVKKELAKVHYFSLLWPWHPVEGDAASSAFAISPNCKSHVMRGRQRPSGTFLMSKFRRDTN